MVSNLTTEPLSHLDGDRPRLLVDHLREVGEEAGRFGERFGAADWARLAGRWHDLGKYGGEFQRRIRRDNGQSTAHLEEGPEERDHSTAGAIHAAKRAGLGRYGWLVGAAIAGHHSGLPNAVDFAERVARPSKVLLYEDSIARGGVRELACTVPTDPIPSGDRALYDEVWTRLVFSALCDADRLDAERFYAPARAALRGTSVALPELLGVLRAHLDRMPLSPSLSVREMRQEVRGACERGAQGTPGVYSLTAPTGSGKTLLALLFALEHAVRHGLDRVVVALPYTAIIEQSAAVFREVFASYPGAVLEHHSALDPRGQSLAERLAAENWDVPIIVTTTVQLFESLLASRPVACRKVHRLARCVVVLDEVQALPTGIVAPVLDVLSGLVRVAGSTVLFSTATRPALTQDTLGGQGLPSVTEVVPDPTGLAARSRRVQFRWPASLDVPTTYEDLAPEIAAEHDVLVVVHRRADARHLTELIDAIDGEARTIHLSALMCPRHRTEVVGYVRAQKVGGIRLVATQLVEAGLDLDFPVVYRALGGLDSIGQAAGRCNREGRQTLGEVRVFLAPTPPPPGVPQRALEVTRSMLRAGPTDPLDPADLRRYFVRLYGNCNLDAHEVQRERRRHNFRRVAERFRVVDAWSVPVVIPYDDEAGRALDDLRVAGPSRHTLRALQPYVVMVPERDRDRMLGSGVLEEVGETGVLRDLTIYSSRFGLCLSEVP